MLPAQLIGELANRIYLPFLSIKVSSVSSCICQKPGTRLMLLLLTGKAQHNIRPPHKCLICGLPSGSDSYSSFTAGWGQKEGGISLSTRAEIPQRQVTL